MKTQVSFIVALCLVTTFSFGQGPQPKSITEKYFSGDFEMEDVTPALKNTKEYTKLASMMPFLKGLSDKKPGFVNYEKIGKTQKGKEIPMLFITNPDSKEEKLRMFIQGGLHGDEPGSTEGVLYFIYELLTKEKYTHLLDRIEFGIIPMANVDGYEKQERASRNTLDLNRDQTKLMAPESIVLKQAFMKFAPHVALDFHEYRPYRRPFHGLGKFGITTYYDAMLLYSGNLNVPKSLRDITQNLFVKNGIEDFKESGLNSRSYSTTKDVYGETQFSVGSVSPRSSVTNYALANTIGTLLEVRGVGIKRASFKRRVFTTKSFAFSYAQTAYDNADLVRSTLAKSFKENEKVTVKMEPSLEDGTLKVIDLNTEEVWDMPVIYQNNLKSIPTLQRSWPKAYIVDKSQTEVIEKLKILGASVEELTEDTSFEVEVYTVTNYSQNPIPYEGAKLQDVETKVSKETKTFSKGSYMVPMNQKNSNLISTVLEPESVSGFVHFDIIKTQLNDVLPIYRVIK